uniref:Uncharacterized protein n=1 Tax=Rhizophora mucronata TaxID=61149 RepID=A0A2P2L2T1_RHIMU
MVAEGCEKSLSKFSTKWPLEECDCEEEKREDWPRNGEQQEGEEEEEGNGEPFYNALSFIFIFQLSVFHLFDRWAASKSSHQLVLFNSKAGFLG